MLFKLSITKTVSEAAADLRVAIEAHYFGLMHVHDLKETMTKKGVEFTHECLVFEVCQPVEVTQLSERLRDPAFTHILLVTLPEATPVHEAAALQEDLRRARIEPFAWVINQSLLNSGSCDPLLQRREESEHRYLTEVVAKHAARTAWLPWQPEEPVGPHALARLGSSLLQPALA